MRKLKINGIYKHFKGNYYVVIDIAYNSENEEKCVIYKNLYDGKLWIREINNFLSVVDHKKYPDIKQKYRFELQKTFQNNIYPLQPAQV